MAIPDTPPAATRLFGDWGTSRLRLWLVRGNAITPWREGPGIGALDRPAADVLRALVAELTADARPARIVLCGMAGARGGLYEAGYVDCPADRTVWARQATRIALDGIPLVIGAGVALPADAPRADVMRGEETQAFGAIAHDPALASGQHTLLLPGTHSKWVDIADGTITGFTTFFTGELFALLGKSTLLTAGVEGADSDEGFAAGLDRAQAGGLLGTLFEARAMQLRQGRSGAWAAGFLSGLLIGGEIAEMAARAPLPTRIPVIGDARLAARYARALATFGCTAQALDAEAVTLAGLSLLDREPIDADD